MKNVISPPRIPFRKYTSAKGAVEALTKIYARNIAFLQENFQAFTAGTLPKKPVRAFYPLIRLNVETDKRFGNNRLSYGYIHRAGIHSTTITRPRLYGAYLEQQFRLLLENHKVPVEIGESDTPIPMHFALGENFHLEHGLSAAQLEVLPDLFDRPDLELMDDRVANCTYKVKPGTDYPLSLFTAPRTDLSLLRLRHYCGTSAHHFQNFVIFTNYQFYIDEFIKIALQIVKSGRAEFDTLHTPRGDEGYTSFVSPGDHEIFNQVLSPGQLNETGFDLKRMPQMPAYHLKRPGHMGITMVNIGVGPSNAKTITDHMAVLRPHAWLMLGHCAGLRQSQVLGDYVLAHAYLRLDNVLNKDLPIEIPIPALAEVQQSLEKAVSGVLGLEGFERKRVMRTGTVATIDDRNWELQPSYMNNIMLSQSRAIAMDMESATIAANGYRFRVPYGTLLCVSDKPFHGQLKLPGMADRFYRERVEQHLRIGLSAMTLLRDMGTERLHSRKLRSFNEVGFL